MSEENEETNEERAKNLFAKGESSFGKLNYLEALHYFKLSNKLIKNIKTEEYIKKCQEKVNEIRQKEKEAEENDKNNNNSQEKSTDDEACEKIIINKNYYEILGVTKTSNNDEIKKAYKKLAIKFHPDKNKSSKAEEAFKKIATAYQTLTDPKKREIFDKYGSEEEYREKVYQERQQQYEEFDPYDIFDMFFSGIDPEIYRRQRRNYRRTNVQTNVNPKVVKFLPYIQLIPFVIMILTYILPNLFQKKEIYVFDKNLEYPIERKTHNYKVKYYVGKTFKEKYPNNTEIKKVEKEIEKNYLGYLKNSCDEKTRYKSELQFKKIYYQEGGYYYNIIQNEINKIDLSVCEKHRKYLRKYNKEDDDDDEEYE